MVATVSTSGYNRTLVASVAGGYVVTFQTMESNSMDAASVFVPDAGHATTLAALTVPSNAYAIGANSVAVYNVTAGWIVLYTFATLKGAAIAAVYVADATHAITPSDFASADYH
jgi:quinol-cytochrome oxidoreductase complex cytochrome b subunit